MSIASVATRTIDYPTAVKEALQEELRRSSDIVMMGHYAPERIFGLNASDLAVEFGSGVFQPVAPHELSTVGAAVGAAMGGLRPIVDLYMTTFAWYAMDALVNQAAKNRFLTGGQASVPAVFTMSLVMGRRYGAHHTDRSYPAFMNIPGMKVATASTPYDVKGLFKTAIRDDNPVLFYFNPSSKSERTQVPPDEYVVPFGQAVLHRTGSAATVVSIATLDAALTAADSLAKEGIHIDVVEPLSLKPLDTESILSSVAKTGHLIVVDAAHPFCSAASEVAAQVAEHGFGSLRSAVRRITAPDVHIPFSPILEDAVWPSANSIINAVQSCLGVATDE